MTNRFFSSLKLNGLKMLGVSETSMFQQHALLDALPGLYYKMEKSKNWGFTYLSGGDLTLGYSSAELLQQDLSFIYQLVCRDDIATFDLKFKPLSDPGELVVLQYRVMDKGRSYKAIKDHFIRCYDRRGELVSVEGVFYEVAHKVSKNQLFQELTAYRNAIDEFILSSITDVRGNIISVNKEFCKVSKFKREELIGQNHRIVCSGHHNKEFFTEMWKTITSGKLWRGEIKNKAKDGSYYWVDTIIIPIANDEGKIKNFLSLRTLITKQKEAEAHKLKYIDFLEKITFTVSHRVRGPLCSIQGLTELLMRGKEEPEKFEETLSHLKKASDHLDDLTSELSSQIYANEKLMQELQEKIEKGKI